MKNCAILITLSIIASSFNGANAFTSTSTQKRVSLTQVWGHSEKNVDLSRREALWNGAVSIFASTGFATKAVAEDDDKTRGGVQLTPFNGLTFNYRGNEFSGLDASTLNEPSIPYKDFLQKLDAGDVEFVEFLAPDGDIAYATLKPAEGEEKLKPIRIGEGYPIEQHDGWSSPAFVVKSVAKKKVPYKFTVPGLAAYK